MLNLMLVYTTTCVSLGKSPSVATVVVGVVAAAVVV
jgi:hypothetical protein